MAHPRSTALCERERIRARLVDARPALAHRLVVGPSGSLTLPVSVGRAIEIGRLPQSGVPTWVVVEPVADGVRVLRPRSLEDCADLALGALARWSSTRARAEGLGEKHPGPVPRRGTLRAVP